MPNKIWRFIFDNFTVSRTDRNWPITRKVTTCGYDKKTNRARFEALRLTVMAIKDGKGKPEKPFWQALGIRYDPRRSRTVDMSLTYQTARREIASCVYNSRESHHATLLFAAFMQPYFNFIDFQLLIVAYALQNIRRRRVIAVAFYVRRRQRIRPEDLAFTSSCELVV